ncbi:Na(+)/H(+) antiporter NhaP [Galdieria sulphuraria]|uniref:Monovalent cation:H+ antiporter-1, CPA1 family n=1 Tax=Galdieria sulphuraria TaxID=130081 RepID=M2Y2Y6_GALSU|nr:monovalent cation:H+ antiporter-1, CPA1 family [Galdieria sulphuraria]EME30303.1 monovalent cation:H+ antiporter-1, CPA1 family [Galdieria sulphuraria]GJD08467.1 Na(+)/H(+) antiporter NhaP [Galdieria sulphuraria]|eukprot:XP_005706823.1 monovalent cation:H+ antiporter-1, CPA1 family [Galdieria sulphuraria]
MKTDTDFVGPQPNDFVDALTMLLLLILLLRWLNKRTFNIPDSIALSLSAVTSSILAILANRLFPHIFIPGLNLDRFQHFTVSFPSFVLDSALGFLLFADAAELDIISLRRTVEIIFSLAVFTTLLASILNAAFLFLLLTAIANPLPFAHCLLFGAIISPTDPIAVNGILKSNKSLLPKLQRFIINGEALFNDAVAVVLFTGLRRWIRSPQKVGVGYFLDMVVREVLFGIVIGLVLGYLAYYLLQNIKDKILEANVTIVLVLMINMTAKYLGASIPLASVVAGLIIGNYGTTFAMSSSKSFHWLWQLISDNLNSILYLLMGFISIALVTLPESKGSYGTNIYYGIFLAMIPLSLFARFLSIFIPLQCLKFLYLLRGQRLHPALRNAVPFRFIGVLTWSGMKGTISVALALSLSEDIHSRNLIFQLCYLLVCFSTVVQGLFYEPVIRWLTPPIPVSLPQSMTSEEKSFLNISGNIPMMMEKDGHKNKPLYREKTPQLEPLPSLSDMIRSVGLMAVALHENQRESA